MGYFSGRPMTGGPNEPNGLAETVRRERGRQQRWMREERPSMARFIGQIGVLGWIIVGPMLIGLFVGRWVDHKLGSGIFWSAPLLVVGVVVGCWSAWQWMHRP
jgi:ATP synthase protein I